MSGRGDNRTIEPHNGRWAGEKWVFHLRTPKARKRYFCDACGQTINKGERYVNYVTANLEGPGMETWHVHGECYEENTPMFSGIRPDWRFWWPQDHD